MIIYIDQWWLTNKYLTKYKCLKIVFSVVNIYMYIGRMKFESIFKMFMIHNMKGEDETMVQFTSWSGWLVCEKAFSKKGAI